MGSAGLRHAYSAATERTKRRHRDESWTGKGGVSRRAEIHMELKQLQGSSRLQGHHVIGRAARRKSSAVKIGRQHTEVVGELETHLRRRVAGLHGSAVVGASLSADRSIAIKHVEGYVVRIRPNTHFRVVIKVGIGERVAIVSAGRVGRSGNGNALQEGRPAGNAELAQDPAVGYLVVIHDRVAVIICLAAPAKSCPERLPQGGTRDHSARCLVENNERRVHPLDILREANSTVGIGRGNAHIEAGRRVLPDAIKGKAGRRRKLCRGAERA